MADIPKWVRYPAALVTFVGGTACGILHSTPETPPTPTLSPTPEEQLPLTPENILQIMRNPKLETWRQTKVAEGFTDIAINYWPRGDPNYPDYAGFDIVSPIGIYVRSQPWIAEDNITNIYGGASTVHGVAVNYSLDVFSNGRLWERQLIFGAKPKANAKGETYTDGDYMAAVYEGEENMAYRAFRGYNPRSWWWQGPMIAEIHGIVG